MSCTYQNSFGQVCLTHYTKDPRSSALSPWNHSFSKDTRLFLTKKMIESLIGVYRRIGNILAIHTVTADLPKEKQCFVQIWYIERILRSKTMFTSHIFWYCKMKVGSCLINDGNTYCSLIISKLHSLNINFLNAFYCQAIIIFITI